MNEVPNWVFEFIKKEKLSCSDCQFEFKAKNLMSIGIHNSTSDSSIEVLAIGLFCNKCKEMVIFEIREMNLNELAMEVLDQEAEELIKNQDFDKDSEVDFDSASVEKSPRMNRKRRSSITNKEIKDAVQYLNSIKSNDEFLLALGMSPAEIDKYNVPKHKRKRNNGK